MLSSLLSLYIAGSLSPDFDSSQITFLKRTTPATIETANFELKNIIDSQTTPIKDPLFIAPILEAKASIAVDLKTGAELHKENIHQRLPIASITKLMTTLIILEENKMNEIVKVSNYAATIEGSQMYLVPGEEMTVEDLLKGTIIGSANDAAVALAEHNAGNIKEFVKKMNQKAKELGLLHTNFENPVGLDNPLNYSSAHDIAKLAKIIYDFDFVKKTANTQEITVKSISSNYTHKLENTNKLLGNEYYNIKGLKTGTTDSAGHCLTTIAESQDGHEIITVVLNSPARFKETKILVDWVFRAYTW